METNLKCCILGCHTRANQGLRFYRFPCHNPHITSIWKRRISQSANFEFDVLNDLVCELHFDYRCKTGNECALEEGSLPTLCLPSFGTLLSTGNAHFQLSDNRIEESSFTISIDALSYHCRICFRRGLLYEIEASTYRSKSFLSLIDLPPNVLPDNIQTNACLSCLKSIVISHQLSMAVEHSNTIVQQLLRNPKQNNVILDPNFLDMKSELAFCNLIPANSLSIKLEIEIEDKMIWANEDYEQKVFGEPTSSIAYVNTQNIVEKSICTAENQDNICKMIDSVTSDKKCPKEFHKSLELGSEYTTDLSAEEIEIVSDHSYSCILMENTDDNTEVSNNSDNYGAEDRQFDNEQVPESTSKVLYEPTYKCDLCKFTTNYKANLGIHNNLHLTGNDSEHFYCQKCEKYFLLRRHFLRHNAILHAVDFNCKVCNTPHASATKLAVHYTEHHHAQMLDHKQGQPTFTTRDKNSHWNDNDGVYVCPICDWKTPSNYLFDAHMSKHVDCDKNSTTGSQELETMETDAVRNADGRYQCSECPKALNDKSNLFVYGKIHTNDRPYKCIECSKTFRNKSCLSIHKRLHMDERPYKCSQCPKSFVTTSSLTVHKRTHTNERPYKCTECLKTFNQKGCLNKHKRIHTNERPYKCTECTKTFSDKSNFIAHGRIHTNDGPYKCTECPKTFSQTYYLNVHKRIHTNNRAHKCTECPKTFSKMYDLNVHKITHTNERPYKCTECPKAFNVKSILVAHKKMHKNERPYKCAECPKTFTKTYNLNVHMRIHTNERPYKCIECPKAFNHSSSLSVHKRLHMKERPYKCTECPKTFSQTYTLNVHKRIHTNERPYKCIECSKTFRNKSYLSVHKRIHTNETPYKCSQCSKSFLTISNLSVHKRIHTNERPYKCSECPKTFSQKGNLDYHKRLHTNERPLKFTECPKTFNSKSTLDTHKRIHTDERPYKCTDCPKTFSKNSNLKRHKRVHTNERPYKCIECPKTFCLRQHLNQHQSTHTNERPYKCSECPKTFSQKGNLDYHNRVHTNETPYKCIECSKTFRNKSDLREHKRIHTN